MALHSADSKVQSLDKTLERIGNGTIGGDFIVPGSVQGKRLSNIVDNSDPRVSYGYYGTGSASFTSQTSSIFARGGTTIWTTSTNGAIQLKFIGTSIAILAPSNPTGDASMAVYIDGSRAYGRIPVFSTISFSPAYSAATPPMSPTSTTVTLTDSSNFASSGYALIDDEVVSYSGIAANVMTITGRGLQGTQATSHYYNAVVYQWSQTVSCYEASGYSTQNMIFYTPFLSPGPHTITMVCSGGGGNMYLDAFVVGSLIGARSVNVQTGTAAISGTTTANGHLEIGALTSVNSDVQIIGVIGYEQTVPTASVDNATTLAKLGVKNEVVPVSGAQSWQPIFYLHNGPGASAITIRITFTYLGPTV